jgi:hypothetical protein
MSTLSAIKRSCDVVQKGKSVSTGAFSLNGHGSLYRTSAKIAVIVVPISGQKSTNMQSTEFHNSVGRQVSTSFLVW